MNDSAFRFSCPKCKKVLKTRHAITRKKSIHCPRCDHRFSYTPAVDTDATDFVTETRHQPAWLLPTVCVIVAVVALGAVGVLLVKDGRQATNANAQAPEAPVAEPENQAKPPSGQVAEQSSRQLNTNQSIDADVIHFEPSQQTNADQRSAVNDTSDETLEDRHPIDLDPTNSPGPAVVLHQPDGATSDGFVLDETNRPIGGGSPLNQPQGQPSQANPIAAGSTEFVTASLPTSSSPIIIEVPVLIPIEVPVSSSNGAGTSNPSSPGSTSNPAGPGNSPTTAPSGPGNGTTPTPSSPGSPGSPTNPGPGTTATGTGNTPATPAPNPGTPNPGTPNIGNTNPATPTPAVQVIIRPEDPSATVLKVDHVSQPGRVSKVVISLDRTPKSEVQITIVPPEGLTVDQKQITFAPNVSPIKQLVTISGDGKADLSKGPSKVVRLKVSASGGGLVAGKPVEIPVHIVQRNTFNIPTSGGLTGPFLFARSDTKHVLGTKIFNSSPVGSGAQAGQLKFWILVRLTGNKPQGPKSLSVAVLASQEYTSEYVELIEDQVAKPLRYRIYDDHCEVETSPGSGQFKNFATGNWQ